MRLILHAGTHKTGTTSIQAALAENRRWLSERGFVYPQLSFCSRSHNGFAHRLALAGKGESLRLELQRAVAGGHAAIMSAEEVSVDTRNWEALANDDYWERRRHYLQKL